MYSNESERDNKDVYDYFNLKKHFGLQFRDRLLTLESDVRRRQTLTSKDDPRSEKVKYL